MKSIIEQKKFLRIKALEKRHSLCEQFQNNPTDISNINQNLSMLIKQLRLSEKIISGYIPIKDEVPTSEMMEMLNHNGYTICLPVVMRKNSPLIFRQYNSANTKMEAGYFGTVHPAETSKELTPSAMIIPMLAFNRKGYRLGFGGGFYDRTIEKLRLVNSDIVCIGLAFAGQEVENVPHNELDQQLDWIVTEKEVVKTI